MVIADSVFILKLSVSHEKMADILSIFQNTGIKKSI